LLSGGLPAGWLDPGFNSVGWTTAQVGAADTGGAGALQPDGKIVLAGSVTGSDGSRTIALARYLPDGQLDTGFGAAGIGFVALDTSLKIDAARAIALVHDPGKPDDGDIVVVGSWSDPATNQAGVALARFTINGVLDTSFGTVGAGVARDSQVPDAQGLAVAILPDGTILVGGVVNLGTSSQPLDSPFLERFHSDGTPGPDFALGLPARYFFQGVSTDWGGMATDGCGHIIVAGLQHTTAGLTIGLVRVALDGTPDPSFGSGGYVTTLLSGPSRN
jgi:uncharacterized delta-60 repeat protein